MTKVITAAAVAALTVTIIAVAGTRSGSARVARPGAPKTVVRTTTTKARSVTTTTAARHRTSRKTVVSAKAQRPGARTRAVRPAATTTTVDPAQRAAVRKLLLEACLDLAAANKSGLIAANDAWYQMQLRALAARRKPASAQYNILQIEESQARSEIQTQYSIDEANCSLK